MRYRETSSPTVMAAGGAEPLARHAFYTGAGSLMLLLMQAHQAGPTKGIRRIEALIREFERELKIHLCRP